MSYDAENDVGGNLDPVRPEILTYLDQVFRIRCRPSEKLHYSERFVKIMHDHVGLELDLDLEYEASDV